MKGFVRFGNFVKEVVEELIEEKVIIYDFDDVDREFEKKLEEFMLKIDI